MKTLGILITLAAVTFSSNANAQKIAYVNLQEVIMLMPEYSAAAKKIDSISRSKQLNLQKLQTEYDSLVGYYQENFESLDATDQDDLLYDIESKKVRYINYQNNIQKVLAEEESKALEPIYAKIQKVVEEVAKEKGYNHVLNAQSMIFTSDQNADITELVIAKLGLERPQGMMGPDGQ